jgi:hypothetical protein
MNLNNFAAIEGYLKTDNQYLNDYHFEILAGAVAIPEFVNLEAPLKCFDKQVEIAILLHRNPVKCLFEMEAYMKKLKFGEPEKAYCYKMLLMYLRNNEAYAVDAFSDIKVLTESMVKRLTKETE